MRFLLDHDVPAEIGRILSQDGHYIEKVSASLSPVATDSQVFNYAVSNGLVIVTCNRDDFISEAAGKLHAGLIILVRRRTRIAECSSMLKLLRSADESGIRHNINYA